MIRIKKKGRTNHKKIWFSDVILTVFYLQKNQYEQIFNNLIPCLHFAHDLPTCSSLNLNSAATTSVFKLTLLPTSRVKVVITVEVETQSSIVRQEFGQIN